jgi:hypothetical protein
VVGDLTSAEVAYRSAPARLRVGILATAGGVLRRAVGLHLLGELAGPGGQVPDQVDRQHEEDHRGADQQQQGADEGDRTEGSAGQRSLLSLGGAGAMRGDGRARWSPRGARTRR